MNKPLEVKGLQFKWGKKRETSSMEQKDIQFYESFTYDNTVYCLYDCVYTGNANSSEFYVGKIIKMWEHNDQRENSRKVELLWFFKPYEVSSIEGVQVPDDVLPNELFLASGSGLGLTNENPLETITGKCNVLCISKDVRNLQPSDEEIKLADFVFHRTFDVGSSKISEKIDNEIAGVDVKFIFNRTSYETKANVVQKVVQGTVDSMKPNRSSASSILKKNESNASDGSGHRMSYHGNKHLAKKRVTFADERSNKDFVQRDDRLDCYNASGSRRDHYNGRKDQGNVVEKQLPRQESRLEEERCSKDSYTSGRLDDKLDNYNASGSRRDHFHGRRDQEHEVEKQLSKEKSRFEEERCRKDSYASTKRDDKFDRYNASGSRNSHCSERKDKDNGVEKQLSRQRLEEERCRKDSYVSGRRDERLGRYNTSDSRRNQYNGRRDQDNELEKQLSKEKSRLKEERCRKDSYSLDEMPLKKQKLVGSDHVSDGRTNSSHKISHDSREDIRPIRSPRDRVTKEEVYSKKPSFTDRKQETKSVAEKGLLNKPSSDCIKSKHTEEKDYIRNYNLIKVIQKPDVEESKWYRNLTWEENLKCSEGKGNVILLQNLDPTYTSNEVENIVYSALNEQCTARMIERTSFTIPHIGEALVIFNTIDAAKRAIRRLDEGCLLLSNGRTLVATNAKVNSLVMPPPLRFIGHIKLRTQLRQGMRNEVATSHCAQRNTIEFDMAMEWALLLERYKLTCKRLSERQIEEKKKLRIIFNPKID